MTMTPTETGRAGTMLKFYRDEAVKDVMRDYFNAPEWKMGWGDPLPAAPLDIQIEMVNRCNLHCNACSIDHQTRDKSTLDWDVLTRLVDHAADEGVCYFTICGMGEATLHPLLFPLLGYIRNKPIPPRPRRTLSFMPTVLISNGMWSTAQVKKCLEAPPDVLSLSLAGLTDAEIVERRGGIDLQHFYANVKTLFEQRHVQRPDDKGLSPTIHISTHIYPHELETRAAEIEAFKEKWFKVCDIVVIKTTEVNLTMQNNKEFTGYNPRNRQFSYDFITDTSFERTAPCFETSRRLSINSDGDVWCGHHLSEEFGAFLGNVAHQTLREIWRGDQMNAFRREVRAGIFNRPACRACGGEIRDEHRQSTREMERVLSFS
jgi:MoaA/NifB/PqqE/SkfB family radical SAM enzyme